MSIRRKGGDLLPVLNGTSPLTTAFLGTLTRVQVPCYICLTNQLLQPPVLLAVVRNRNQAFAFRKLFRLGGKGSPSIIFPRKAAGATTFYWLKDQINNQPPC